METRNNPNNSKQKKHLKKKGNVQSKLFTIQNRQHYEQHLYDT